MGVDRGGIKGRGFFHLLEWSKKSPKKLFPSERDSPEVTGQGKQSGDNSPPTEIHLCDEEEIVGESNMQASSDYRFAACVTDEEGNGMMAPGVVARLMGLDSMPTSSVFELNSTPLHNSRSLLDDECCKKRRPEFYINDRFNHVSSNVEGYSRKTPESRTQKMQSSSIERFQREALHAKSTRSLPIVNHKLLSPLKNSGFISTQNAANVNETASKTLELELRTSINGKIQDSNENLGATQRTLRLTGSSRRPIESTAMRSPLNRNWSVSEDTTASQSSLDVDETNPAGAKGRGKSISLAVRMREGLSTCNKDTLVQKDRHECKLNWPLKGQPNNQNNEQLVKASTNNASGVLWQNNQKHNCSTRKGKLSLKPSISNQQGRKVPAGNVSSGKNKTVNKLSRNSKVGYRKKGSAIADPEKEVLSSTNNNLPPKKRMIEGDVYYEKSGPNDNILVNRHEKHVHHNIVVDEKKTWTEDNRRNDIEIISFTFMSPMVKPISGSKFSSRSAEKWNKSHAYCFDVQRKKTVLDADSENLSYPVLKMIDGHALGVLLEQKLQKLTYGFDLSYSNLVKAGSDTTSSPNMRASVSAFDTPGTTAAQDKKDFRSCIDELGGSFDSSISSTDGQAFRISHKLLEAESLECSSSCDSQKEPDHHHQSPFSVLETSFSNESCDSSESWGSAEGKNMHPSSIQAQHIVSLNCTTKLPSAKAEMELSDSASSAFRETVTREINRTIDVKACRQELDYLREILSNIEPNDLQSYYAVHAGETLDPLLFDKLEYTKRSIKHGEDTDFRVRRKTLFDCMNECLGQKRSRYFQAGYRAWAKGMAIVGKEMAEELYKEIVNWKSMGDWMVNELVDKDMSIQLGRWINFEIEAFESGVEIESGIFSSLVDEVAADFLIKC